MLSPKLTTSSSDVEAADAAAAVSQGAAGGGRVNVSGLPPWSSVVQATASTAAEQDRMLSSPDWPQLVGVSEIAALLGTTRNRAWQVTKKPDFPQPLADLAAGPIWALPTVAAFLEQWRRRPGPPPGAKQNASKSAQGKTIPA